MSARCSGHRLSMLARSASAALVPAFIIWWAVDRGQAMRKNPDVKLGAAPLVGRWDWMPTWRILPALGVGVLALCLTTRRARSLRPAVVMPLIGVLTSGWTVALAWSQGTKTLIAPITDPTEYRVRLPKMPPARAMLRVWADPMWMRNQTTHLKGHPPGYMLLLKALRAIGLGSPWAIAALSWVGAGVAAVLVIHAARLLAGDESWQTMVPFVVVAPYAMWMGTSADAVFAAVGAGGVVLSIAALKRASVALAGLAGVTLGVGLMLSYGLVTLLTIVGFVILGVGRGDGVNVSVHSWSSRIRIGVGIAIGLAAVLLGMRLIGFWWFDGLATTRYFYWAGTAKFRPWGYFFVANTAVVFIAVGPIISVHLASARKALRPKFSVMLLPLGALVAITAANLSQLSKGETERIWLPFLLFLLPVVTTRWSDRRIRVLLSVQVIWTLILQLGLLSKW